LKIVSAQILQMLPAVNRFWRNDWIKVLPKGVLM
jgi:hypothetical protein